VRIRSGLGLALGAAAAFVLFGCPQTGPEGRAETGCHEQCVRQASARCTKTECVRGCRFILDRLVEREGPRVVSCVAKGRTACNDVAWADCAARVGPHADGGPPAPAAAEEEW